MTPSAAVKIELEERIAALPLELQKKVLEFARSIAPFKGTQGTALLEFAGQIPPAECAAMLHAIEEGCESVDPNGW